MNIVWKQITEADRDLILQYYKKEQPMGCELTFGNNVLWAPFFLIKYAIVEDTLVFVSGDGRSVSFPQGKTNIKAAVECLMEYFIQQNTDFYMYGVTPQQFMQLESIFPEKFQIEYDRAAADYVYETEKLRTLAGSKLHGKRNHINRFKEMYPDWTYERIMDTNRAECLAMAEKWWAINSADNPLKGKAAVDMLAAQKEQIPFADFEKRAEFEVTKHALMDMERLGLKGGMLRAGGEVVAFSIGEEASEDTFVVHIEKAFANVQGAYPMINQQFVLHEMDKYTYVNREEDAGVEGLRKAKLSYRPTILLEKGNVTLK